MKRWLPYLSILSLTILLVLAWIRLSPPPVEEVLQAESTIGLKKIQIKSPKRIKQKEKEIKKKELPVRNSLTKKNEHKRVEAPNHSQEAMHLQDSNGNLIITSVDIVDKLIIAHGDLIVGEIEDQEEFLERARSGKPLILPTPKLWDYGTIPYSIDPNLKNKESIEKAIQTINSLTNTKWIPKNYELDFVHFTKGSLNCYSSLGRVGGEQKISLTDRCSLGSIMHEMLHAMGLLHEQNREDRDEYIQILWENIDTKNHLQFQKIRNELLDIKDHPFDFKSLMLYGQSSFSKYPGDYTIVRSNGDSYSPNKEALSDEDLKKLSVLYPKRKD